MKIAALQLNAVFADVPTNLSRLELFVADAARQGASILLLPEFFTSAMGFSPNMLQVAPQGHQVLPLLQLLSANYQIAIGGSYLLFDGEASANVFHLVFPNGDTYTHKKDLPTQLENCYFSTGDTLHILETPLGNIGSALCWEQLRWDTVKRMQGKVDFVLAASCWWDLPDDAPPERDKLREFNRTLALEAPRTLARLLGVPVIHAAHCGKVTALRFPAGDRDQTRQLVGGTQFITGAGIPVAVRTFAQGEGIVVADLPEKSRHALPAIPENCFWIPDLPQDYLNAWEQLNRLGQNYYTETALPYYKKCGPHYSKG